jgi:peptide/nickel transport system substrate-binding protein
MRLRWIIRTVAAVSVTGLVAAACSSSSSTITPGSPSAAPVQGGKIVLGAEQYPECINVITQCASASWLYWSATQYVMPRAMMVTVQGTFDKSPLITEAPTLANGDLTSNPFTVKFKINPAAKWADGTPITCDDFEFTRNAIINTKGTYGTAGYDQIDKIDCSNEAVAVLNYKTVYVDWYDVFGGSTGVVLEKAAFPNENTQTKIDLSTEMQSDIPFSGGPWKLQSWSKDQTVLVRNDAYWGHKPYLDQVTIVPRTDPATEINSLLSGDVSAIFPQPGTVSFVQQFASVPAIKFKADPGTVFYEALWMNLSKFPFNDKAVREAMFWATDRQAVVDGLVKKNNPNATVLGCGVLAFPGVGPWCDPPNGTPFAQYKFDATKVSDILTAAGWAKDSKGIWAKGGQELAFTYETTQKDRRIATQALLKEKFVEAGFKVTLKVDDATLLFETKLPKGDFQVADFAEGGSPDPSITGTLACKNIPSAANGFAGANDFRWCNPQADALMAQADQELDTAKRAALMQQMYALEAQDFAPGVPLYTLAQITAWRSDKVAGPIGKWNNTTYSGFFNIDEWYCVTAGACG